VKTKIYKPNKHFCSLDRANPPAPQWGEFNNDRRKTALFCVVANSFDADDWIG